MNALKTLPANFTDALKAMIGLNIYICCCEGRLCYCGKLIKVLDDSLIIYEGGGERFVWFSNICFFMFYNENEEFPTPNESTNSELFERFNSFLNEKVELVNINGSVWAVGGRLVYIENDYLVLIEKSERAAIYVHAINEFSVKDVKIVNY